MPTIQRPIEGFSGKYRFLSNFWEVWGGITVNLTQDTISLGLIESQLGMHSKTSEHLYQAAKVSPKHDNVRQMRRIILEAPTAGTAKRLGINVPIREDWEAIKVDVMTQIVRAKFSQHEHLKQKLLDTGTAYLEETNYWGDTFWGVCKGRGENHLGNILMKVREELS